MPDSIRPVPVPTAETLPYWEAAKRGVLALAKCRDCGRIPFPPRASCPDCLSDHMVWTELSGNARLRGWCQIHIPAIPGRAGPVTVVEAMLEEDPRAVVITLDETGAVRDLAPDAPLRLDMRRDPNGWSYPEARPRAEEPGA